MLKVYFYGNPNEDYSLPDVQEVTISENTEFVYWTDVEGIGDSYHRMMPGTYPVSYLEQFGARLIKAYDYNY